VNKNNIITSLSKEDINDIAKIHLEALSQDFLPSLGKKFLEVFYKGVLKVPNSFALISKDNNTITGFIIGTSNMTNFFKKVIKSKAVYLSFIVFIKIINNPKIIKNVIDSLFYTANEKGPAAELVIIAIDNNYRGKNIGKELVKALEFELNNIGVKEYKVSVTNNNEGANLFYNKLGFKLYESFDFNGKYFNCLVKVINE